MALILNRRGLQGFSSHLSSAQIQMDHLQMSFSDGATDWRALSSMALGSLAYRATSCVFKSLPLRNLNRWITPALSLSSEVSVYRASYHLLSGSTHGSWATDFVNFASLKSFGRLAQQQNVVLCHAFQNLGMMVGHHFAYALHLTTRPEGSFAEQFLHAEMTNWQMKAGMQLFGVFTSQRFNLIESRLHLLEQSYQARSFSEGSNAIASTPRLNIFSAQETRSIGRGKAAQYQTERLPELYVEDMRLLQDRLRKHIEALAPSVKVLEMEWLMDPKHPSIKEFRGARRLEKFYKDMVGDVLSASHLEELRIHQREGEVLQLFRFKSFDASKQQEIESIDFIHHPREEGFEAFGEDRTHVARARVVFPLHAVPREKFTLGEYLQHLRALSQLGVSELLPRLETALGYPVSEHTYRKYEQDRIREIPLPVLTELARLYQVDPRKLIIVSNRSRFPELNPDVWQGSRYPLYLEKDSDVLRVKNFALTDPQRRSLGYVLYEFRKNPFQPMEMVTLESVLGYADKAYPAIELNKVYPTFEHLKKMAQVTGRSLDEILEAANQTWHADLYIRDTLDAHVYIEPLSDDRQRIMEYRKNPGTLGQRLFVWRKRQGFTMAEAAEYVGISESSWRDREQNVLDVEGLSLRTWLDLFDKLGLDKSSILERMEAKSRTVSRAGELLLSALGSEGVNTFALRLGICEKYLGEIAQGKRAGNVFVDPDYLLRVADGLPDLERDVFYAALHPDVVKYFPEVASAKPVLHLTEDQIRAASSLHLGDLIFEHRMEHGLSQIEMGKRIGVSNQSIRLYEGFRGDIQDAVVLESLAYQLGLDRRVFYVAARFPVLRMFRILDPSTGKTRLMSPLEYQDLNQERIQRLRYDNMRNDIVGAMRTRGIEGAEALSKAAGVALAKAKVWLFNGQRLSIEDINILVRTFPELSYRSFYEHFFHAPLAYFFGVDSEGRISYRLSNDVELSSSYLAKIPQAFEAHLLERYGSLYRAERETGLSIVANRAALRRFFDGKSDEMLIANLARVTGFPKADLYAYMRRDELPVLREP